MESPRTALYTVIPTSPGCLSCRLYVGSEIIWSNRVQPSRASEEKARARMLVWARQQGVRVVDYVGVVLWEPVREAKHSA